MLKFSGNLSELKEDKPDIQSALGLTSSDICCSHHVLEAVKAQYFLSVSSSKDFGYMVYIFIIFCNGTACHSIKVQIK